MIRLSPIDWLIDWCVRDSLGVWWILLCWNKSSHISTTRLSAWWSYWVLCAVTGSFLGRTKAALALAIMLLAAAYRGLHGDGICFANVVCFYLIPSTPLNGSLRNFNTWRVSVGNRTLRRDFWVSTPRGKGAPKLPIFNDFATQRQLWDPISPARNMI